MTNESKRSKTLHRLLSASPLVVLFAATANPATTPSAEVFDPKRCAVTQDISAGPHQISVASMNIKALPGALLSKDDHFEANRRSCMGEFARQFDVVSAQEGFYQTQRFIAAADKPYSWHEDFKSGLIRDSGLVTLSNYRLKDQRMVPFNSCAGYFSDAGDCFARKGVTSTKLDVPGGQCLTVINTHMDAGRRRVNQRVRLRQLEVLRSNLPKDCNVVLTGDLNFKGAHKAKLVEFLADTGFKTALFHAPDIIAYRGNIRPVQTKIHDIEGRFTDHEAISVVFEFDAP